MKFEIKEIAGKALKLPPSARASLVEMLLKSLDHEFEESIYETMLVSSRGTDRG